MTSTNWIDLLNEAKQNGGQQDFGPIPAGEYHLKIVEAKVGQTGTGKTKYTIKTQVQGAPHAGRLVWDDLIVSPESAGAMGFFFRKMKALGLDENFFATQPSDDQIVNALTGREFLGKVIIDNFGNKDRNKIDGYKPLAAVNAGGFIPPAPQAAAAAPAPFPQAAPAPAPAVAPQAAPVAPQAAPWEQAAPAQAPAPQTAPAPAQAPAAAPSPWEQAAPAPAAPAPAPQFPAAPF